MSITSALFGGRSQPRAARLKAALPAVVGAVLLHDLARSTLSVGFVAAPRWRHGDPSRGLALGVGARGPRSGDADEAYSVEVDLDDDDGDDYDDHLGEALVEEDDAAVVPQAEAGAAPMFEVDELAEAYRQGRWRSCIVLVANEDNSYKVRLVGDTMESLSRPQNKIRKSPMVSQGPLQVGKKYTGLVTGVTDFAAFVHLGGTDKGMVHSSCIRSGWCLDVFEEVEEGEYVDVWVKEVKGDQISLVMAKEKLQPIIVPARNHLDESDLKVGDTFKAMVWELKGSYCWVRGFVRTTSGLVAVPGAMLRLSQMATPDLAEVVQRDGELRTSVSNVADIVHVGQELEVTIMRIEPNMVHVTAMPLEDALRLEQARQERRRAQGLVGVSLPGVGKRGSLGGGVPAVQTRSDGWPSPVHGPFAP